VPNGQPCHPVLCPNGTKLPNGEECPAPDLSGEVKAERTVNQQAKVTVRVTNTGTAPALIAGDRSYAIDVGLYRSVSDRAPIAGTKIVRIKPTNTLAPGTGETFETDIPLTSNLLPLRGKMNVCVDIDPEEVENESNEDNNRTCQAI